MSTNAAIVKYRFLKFFLPCMCTNSGYQCTCMCNGLSILILYYSPFIPTFHISAQLLHLKRNYLKEKKKPLQQLCKIDTRNGELYNDYKLLLSVYSCSSEPDYNSALLQCGVTIQSDGSKNSTQPHWEWKDFMQTPSLLLNQARGNDALHNGSVVLLAPQRKLQLSDQTPKKQSKVSLGKYQLPAHDFRV